MSQSEHDTPPTLRTMYLAPFACDLPLLHTPEGDFVPLVALCIMLGLPTSPYIAIACKRFRPGRAIQRLPFRESPDRPSRQVWCLREEMVAIWLWSVRSDRVSPARREQLRAFHHRALEVADQVYASAQQQYRMTRSDVFEWLLVCQDVPTRLRRIAERAARRLHPNHHAELDALMARGYALFEESATQARAVVEEILQQPALDTVEVNAEGEVVETGSMPLLPMLASRRPLQQSQIRIAIWLYDFDAFLKAQGLL